MKGNDGKTWNVDPKKANLDHIKQGHYKIPPRNAASIDASMKRGKELLEEQNALPAFSVDERFTE